MKLQFLVCVCLFVLNVCIFVCFQWDCNTNMLALVLLHMITIHRCQWAMLSSSFTSLHKSIQVHLKSLQLFDMFTKKEKKKPHQYLNESFACRRSDCLHSLSPCIKAPYSIPTELRFAHVQLFISLCQEFSLASTCQYPPQIGRQSHIWHMVQSSAAFPSVFSWPASTP